jgi:PBP1b-binding outer membrane lipoprotein LpoB
MKRVALALLLTAAVAGCGTQSQSSSADKFKNADQKAVAQQIEDLESAGKRGKADDICSDILAKSLVAQLDRAGTSCGSEMKKAIDDANEFNLTVEKVTVNGDSATAEVKQGDNGPTETMQFTKENGQWRATSLSEG